jgi:uncharacterized radical SAM protein YgiQ
MASSRRPLVPLRTRRPSPRALSSADFLPTTLEEARERGWDELDVVLVNGDAYVDHPTFGCPLIGRLLAAQGYRVGIISQPDWRDPELEDLRACGRPRLFFGISSGNMDSMVNHYTAHKRPRRDDAYTPGGEAGARPDRATTVYANRVRAAYKDVPIVLGGVEASLRRLAHYDYWSDSVRRSILLDAKEADLVVYGMAEGPIVDIARRLAEGWKISEIRDIAGTAWRARKGEWREILAGHPELGRGVVELPSFEAIASDKRVYAEFSRLYHLEHNHENARFLVQPHGDQVVVVNPPAKGVSTAEFDAEYELPFTKRPHPMYGDRKIAAWEQIKHSVTIMRGCAAGCSFCCITEHQGRDVVSRSEESVLREIDGLQQVPGYTGVVSDVGGPTANMWHMVCTDDEWHKACRRASCLYPTVCEKFGTDHGPLVQLLRKARGREGVKKVLVASGVRYDLAYDDEKSGQEYIRELVMHHVGGHLKIAPEHISKDVVQVMKKPGREMFVRFMEEFRQYSDEAGKEQYLVPYFISSHPGCELKDMIELNEFLEENNWRPQQVQDFTPTPMTLATDMYWSGYHPNTGKPIYAARSMHEKRLQKALLQAQDPENRSLVREARTLAGLPPDPPKRPGPPPRSPFKPKAGKTPRPGGGRSRPR